MFNSLFYKLLIYVIFIIILTNAFIIHLLHLCPVVGLTAVFCQLFLIWFICAVSLGFLLYFVIFMILLTNAFTIYLVFLCCVLNLMLYFVNLFFYSCFYQLLFYVIFIFALNNSFIVYLVYLCSVLWLTGLFCNFILLFTLLSSTVWCNLFDYFNKCIWYSYRFFVLCRWAYCCILSSYSFINAFINYCFMYSL